MAITAEALIRETLVSRIHDSCDKLVALATMPTEAALLAAQQVQNIRLSDVETPNDVGWGQIALEFLLGFVINSSFMDKLAAKLFSKVFGRLLQQQQVLYAVEKEFDEKFLDDLIKAEEQLAPTGTPALRNALKQAVQGTEAAVKKLAAAEAALARELARAATPPREIGEKQLVPYALGISDVLSQLDKKDAAAFVKATKEAVKKGPVAHHASLPAQDTAGVGIVEHFMAASSAQRLHVCAMHNRYEYWVRTLPLQSSTLAKLATMFDRSLLDDLGSATVDLDDMRAGLKVRIEAMIWAAHLGFSKARTKPDIITNRTTEYDCIIGVKERITKYLFGRFGDTVEMYMAKHRRTIIWARLNTGPKAMYLRDYFWAIMEQLDK